MTDPGAPRAYGSSDATASNLPSGTPAPLSPVGGFATRLSLRTRLVVSIVAVAAVIQAVLAAFVYSYFDSTIDAFFAQRLSGRMKLAAKDLEAAPVPLTTDTLRAATDRTLRMYLFNSLILAVRTPDGTVIACSEPDVSLASLPSPGTVPPNTERPDFALIPGIGNGNDDSVPARALTLPVTLSNGATVMLTGAVANLNAHSLTTFIGRAVIVASLLGLIATAAATWVITGIALKPLARTNLAESFHLDRLALPDTGEHHPTPPELDSLAQQLSSARDRIRVALSANERFIANVSHELKTPVAVLRTEAQMLDQSTLTPQARAFVHSVIDETRRLGAMVDSFLTLASVRSGQTLSTSKPVYVNDMLLESVARANAFSRHNNVTVRLALADLATDLVVAGNPELLALLIDNLLRNAVRFSPASGIVEVAVSAQQHDLCITVTDAGPGIPPELLPRLFERFSQASTEATRGRGHGLGLSIAQGIAELHQGQITAENLKPPQSGCRFSVCLPRANSLDAPPAADSPAAQA